MTRLSDALKRAAETANTPLDTTEQVTPPASGSTWQFAPVETMHVPEEPASAPEELRRGRPAFAGQSQSAIAVAPAPFDLDDEPIDEGRVEAPAFTPPAAAPRRRSTRPRQRRWFRRRPNRIALAPTATS
jgi:hypothetical protein